ncbi:MAG: mechanosensitive ion channel family protein [Arenicella sp.]|nr:mechanosensitive ion channel family protein [Arenicella sp.]
MTEILSAFINNFDQLNLFIIGASLVLFIAARPICRWLSDDDGLSIRISMMRVLNSLIILGVLADELLLRDETLLSKLTYSLIVIYFAVVGTQFINFLIHQRFGKVRKSKSKRQVSDTYSSRGLSLFVAAVVTVVAIVSCLRILGLNSLLEAGGAVGIIGIFLAMTQASWAPDIISGLIILNSRMAEEGDVVQFNMGNRNIVASIFKTKVFHTEFLDLSNNHRLMVRNAKLRDYGLQNLSRFASAKGLRERLLFNIGYAHSQQEVTDMMNRAFAEIDKSESLREHQFEPEVMVLDTGDYAVEWAVNYYIKDVKQLLKIKQIFRSYILAESVRSNISLATPNLQINQVSVDQGLLKESPLPKQAPEKIS